MARPPPCPPALARNTGRCGDAQFTDVSWSDTDVPVAVTNEVLHRTPGFHGWQQERWLHHCNDAAAFYGRAGADDLAAFPDAVQAIREQW
ncbi:CbrC family protein [Dactylosporangium sp. NPDC000555]|uniref:CbrC family protein n=1 Tax=Dactylosporangium sp. NPDC000555 TaxID=3154260 RepID=UPI003320A739